MNKNKLGFHHIGLKYADLEKSLQFYRAIGLREVVRWGDVGNEIVMLEMDDGGRIELLPHGGNEFSPNGKWLHFAISVDDVDGAYETALAAGAVSSRAPKTVPLDSKPDKISIRVAFVKGPDGEEVEFFKQMP
ncbi:MAG: VOC family protein [Clostridia bacterium]|nr:VOC family protein [Clostridia bacterium]